MDKYHGKGEGIAPKVSLPFCVSECTIPSQNRIVKCCDLARLLGLQESLTLDPGNFIKALSVIGVVSNVNGLLDDLGMAEIPEGTEWFYERSSWVAWGALLYDAPRVL